MYSVRCTNVQYKNWESSSKASVVVSRRDLVDFLADAFYVAPITELALLHASASSSFSFSASPSPPPMSSTPVAGTFYFVANYSSVASSADMLAYSLGAAITDGIDPFSTDVVYSSTDKLLAETVLRYWISFIRTGCAAVAQLHQLTCRIPLPSRSHGEPVFEKWEPAKLSRCGLVQSPGRSRFVCIFSPKTTLLVTKDYWNLWLWKLFIYLLTYLLNSRISVIKCRSNPTPEAQDPGVDETLWSPAQLDPSGFSPRPSLSLLLLAILLVFPHLYCHCSNNCQCATFNFWGGAVTQRVRRRACYQEVARSNPRLRNDSGLFLLASTVPGPPLPAWPVVCGILPISGLPLL